MDYELICPCGRKMTPEAGAAHMAECPAVPLDIRELNRKFHDALVKGAVTGDWTEHRKLYASVAPAVPLWRRLKWYVTASLVAIRDALR